MFKNDFQGGNFFEIFNPAVKDPLSNCKLTGPHGIQKIFDREVKSSIYQLDGMTATTKITIPKDSKQGLSLIQRCLVFQLYLKQNQDFSMEIGITDLSQNKRNLLLSTSHKELNIQPLSARIPIKNIIRTQWTNFVFDLASMISELWRNQTFKSIDSISVSANCKLRKIFTLKNVPSIEFGLAIDDSLISVDFPQGTESYLQLFTLKDLKSNTTLDQTTNTIESTLNKTKNQNVFKIAFGSKVPKSIETKVSNPHSSIKSAKSQVQIDQSNNFDLSLKSTGFAPLSMSNNNLSIISKSKSGSDTHLVDKSNFLENSQNSLSTRSQRNGKLQNNKQESTNSKTNVNQRAGNKSAPTTTTSAMSTARTQRTSLNSSTNRFNNLEMKQDESKLNSHQNGQVNSNNDQTSKNDKKNEDSALFMNKIPHPPQSTRPNNSARKIRLTSAVKSNSNHANNNTNGNALKETHLIESSANKPNINELSNQSNVTSNRYIFENNKSNHFTGFNLNSADASNSKLNDSGLSSNMSNKTNMQNMSYSNNLLNESINDLLQAFKQQQQQQQQNHINNSNSNLSKASSGIGKTNSELCLDDSSKTIVYSFSSKPKPVIINDEKQSEKQTHFEQNNRTSSISSVPSKTYDHRKYAVNSSNNTINANISNTNSIVQVNQKQETFVESVNSNAQHVNKKELLNGASILLDSLNPVMNTNESLVNENYNNVANNKVSFIDVTDSFEIRMLQDLKAEMDSETSNQRQNDKHISRANKDANHEYRKNSSSSPVEHNFLKPYEEPKFYLNPKSPDAEYIEAIKREASGIQSPFSDRTTSEKYNFEVATSSIEDTASISRKNIKADVNNYHEEMNISLHSNLHTKSTNFKDMPNKYSPLLSNYQNDSNKLHRNSITEEPIQYDDSQADIDEIPDSEDEVDLLYDAALNCYYDPKTGTYYELNLES